jgi:hypothetical protein
MRFLHFLVLASYGGGAGRQVPDFAEVPAKVTRLRVVRRGIGAGQHRRHQLLVRAAGYRCAGGVVSQQRTEPLLRRGEDGRRRDGELGKDRDRRRWRWLPGQLQKV